MLNKLLTIGSLAGVLCFTSLGHSQAMPTATSHGAAQVGLGWSWAKPDYGPGKLQGISAFADLDFTPHIGLEGEFHYLTIFTPGDLGENSYLVGPRFVLPHGKFSLYAKALIGIGNIAIDNPVVNPQGGDGNYIAYVGGGGVDYRAANHIVVRGDFEYHHWNYLHGLTPTVFTAEVAYRFR
jgi:hypothetical protein